jgi:chaperonin cofactor prefoldin
MYEVINTDSDVFKNVKDMLLESDEEDLVKELENNVIELIDTLKNVDENLSKYADTGYKERISVI